MWIYVTLLHYTLKNGLDGQFYVYLTKKTPKTEQIKTI